MSAWVRHCCVGLTLLLAAPLANAADTTGLDLTIQVIGAEEPVSERAHRIAVPGQSVPGGGVLSSGAAGAEGRSAEKISVAPVIDGLQSGIQGILQNPIQGTLDTVDGVTGGLLETLGLTPKPAEQ